MTAKPNFSQLHYLVGTWACSTKSARRPAAYTSTSTYSLSPDGWWLNETTVTNAMSWYPHKYASYDKITYDAGSKRWADVSWSDLGGYGLSVSSGPNKAGSLVWHDLAFAPNADIKSQSDVTVKKNSNAKTTATSSFTEAKGRVVSVVTVCNKK